MTGLCLVFCVVSALIAIGCTLGGLWLTTPARVRGTSESEIGKNHPDLS